MVVMKLGVHGDLVPERLLPGAVIFVYVIGVDFATAHHHKMGDARAQSED